MKVTLPVAPLPALAGERYGVLGNTPLLAVTAAINGACLLHRLFNHRAIFF